MSEKVYLHLLFFCGILNQGVFSRLSDKDTRLSSDFLIRKRRVISHLPGGRQVPPIEEFNFLVKIKEVRHRPFCSGAILSHYTVITSTPCIYKGITAYKVFSGGAYDNRCNCHNITSKVELNVDSPQQFRDSIVLITVDPTFVFTARTGPIQLNVEPLTPGAMATVSGWGFSYPIQPGWETRQRLHYIFLPIMNHNECQAAYLGRFNITDKHICTYCPQQYCARNDEGAPLVVHNMLAGLHIWKGEDPGEMNPDVYINLQHAYYSEWMREHSLLM